MKPTNSNRGFAVFIGGPTASANLAGRTHATVRPRWRSHYGTCWPWGNARGRPRRRACHCSVLQFAATKYDEIEVSGLSGRFPVSIVQKYRGCGSLNSDHLFADLGKVKGRRFRRCEGGDFFFLLRQHNAFEC